MRIVYMGSPDFAVLPMQALLAAGHEIVGVVSQPDRPQGRKRQLTPTPVKIAALMAGLPVLTPEKVNESEVLETLSSWQPELLVVAAFGQILKKPLLELAPLGAVNIHASLLPAYRGAAPIHWAIINGEKETGITTMYMNEKLDAGDMILQQAIPIAETDDTGKLYEKLSQIGAELIVKTVALIAQGKAPRIPQNHAAASYASLLKREHERLDWQKSAQQLSDQIRGLSPWPVAYTLLDGQVFKIWQAHALSEACHGKPGLLLPAGKDGVKVTTGEGTLLLEIVQPYGKSKMAVSDWRRGLGEMKDLQFI